MPKKKRRQENSQSPYKRSIWVEKSEYDIRSLKLGEQEKDIVSRLMSVDAAKKRTPPIPIAGLIRISNLARSTPKSDSVKPKDIEEYLLETTKISGAGIATSICMLSVERNGEYPPIDTKFSAGMESMGVISSWERRCLEGSNIQKFSKVYTDKVIPSWKESLKTRTPQEADEYWGRGGREAT